MEQHTYDPILDSEILSLIRLLRPLRTPQPGTAMVLLPIEGDPVTIRHGQPVPDARYGRYQRRFLVDVAEHRLALDITVLSRDPNFGFRAKVSLTCQIIDPAQIVTRGIRDVSAALYDPIRRMLREVSREYDVREFHDAERALNVSMASFAGDRAIRLYNIRVELLIDDDEVVTSGRAFRDLERETRLDDMRRTRHLTMMRREGPEGLLAGIVEREGPRAALEWIAKAEATERAELRAALDNMLKHTGGDLEPFMVHDALDSLVDRITGRSSVPFRDSRVRGVLPAGARADVETRPVVESSTSPVVESPATPVADAPAEAPPAGYSDGPPEDEPVGPPGVPGPAEDRSERKAGEPKRVSRVRGMRP